MPVQSKLIPKKDFELIYFAHRLNTSNDAGDEAHAFPLDKLAAYTKQPLQFFIDRMTPANGYVEGGRYIRNTTRVLKFEIRKPGSDQPVTKSWSNTSRIIITFDAALDLLMQVPGSRGAAVRKHIIDIIIPECQRTKNRHVQQLAFQAEMMTAKEGMRDAVNNFKVIEEMAGTYQARFVAGKAFKDQICGMEEAAIKRSFSTFAGVGHERYLESMSGRGAYHRAFYLLDIKDFLAAGYDFTTSVSMSVDIAHGMQGVYGANTPLQRARHMVVNKKQRMEALPPRAQTSTLARLGPIPTPIVPPFEQEQYQTDDEA